MRQKIGSSQREKFEMKPSTYFRCGLLILGGLLVFGMSVAGPYQPQSERSKTAQQTKTFADRVREEGHYKELSLKDAIRLALVNNLDIAIQNFNEETLRQNVRGAHGAYDPTLSFNVGWRSSTRPITNTLTAGGNLNVFRNDGLNWDTTLVQPVRFGGRFQLDLTNRRDSDNSTFNTLNPRFNANFNVRYTQPLWKGFIDTSQERQIKISNLDLEISDLQFEQRVSLVVRQVQDLYWDLVLAIDNFEAERRSMNLAIVAFQDSEKRVEIGIEAPIQITSARSEVATREQSMIQSEVGIVNAENDLKNLLAAAPDDSLWDLRILPTDRPDLRQPSLALREAIAIAIKNRPELKEFDKRLEKNAVDKKFYRRERRPKIDLNISYGSVGARGDAFTAGQDENGFPILIPSPNSPSQGGFGSSYAEVFGFNFTNYSVSADITIPLRNRVSDAAIANASIAERRLLSERRQTQQRISVEVRKAFQQIEIQKKRLDATRVARELQEEQLDGENKRLQAGLSRNFEVLRIQRDLANAVKDELAAQIAYSKAITALKQAMYTLVASNDIVLAKGTE